jgi:hypothetical protein
LYRCASDQVPTFFPVFVAQDLESMSRPQLTSSKDETKARGVLRRAISSSLRGRQDSLDSPTAPTPVSEDSIVGLDEIGDDDADDRNLELQQLGLSKRRAKSFAQELDASMTRSRIEEIIYIESSRRPRTLRATELEAWFSKINPKALSSGFRLDSATGGSSSSTSLSTPALESESSNTASSTLSEYEIHF